MKTSYTTTEAAELCGVSRGTILRWIQEGRLKAPVTLGGHHRIQSDELTQLMAQLGIRRSEKFLNTEAPVLKILLVDDDESLRKLIRHYLEECFWNAEILEAADGFSAGVSVEKHHPQLILLDILLPGIKGDDLCTKIRHLSNHYSPAILAMTAYGDEWEEPIVKAGANYFLRKPFSRKDFVTALQKMLDRAPSQERDVIKKSWGEAA